MAEVCCLSCGALTGIPFCWACGSMWTVTLHPEKMHAEALTKPYSDLVLDLT